jgi:hypothetical protein
MLDWQPIVSAPFDRELQVSVIEEGEVYPLVFACRRTADGWAHAKTGHPVFIRPTHWRFWPEE